MVSEIDWFALPVTVSKPMMSTVAKVIPASRPIAPATASSGQVKITLPVSQNVQLVSVSYDADSF
jgi:hypothetical protein